MNRKITARKGLVFAALTLAHMACSDEVLEPAPGREERAQALVGGEQVVEGKWDSAVFWATDSGGACSGAVVGPRHVLTAAHCVQAFDSSANVAVGRLRGGLEQGKRLGITNKKVLDQGGGYELNTIELVSMHPGWMTDCLPSCPFDNSMKPPFPPDLAVIELQQEISDRFARASVLTAPVLPGTPVSIMGYGCEGGVGQPMSGNVWRLKAFDTVTGNAQYVVHPSSFVAHALRTIYERHYVITPGLDLHDAASLCPGDSGGPLYLTDDAAGEVVVGVNAYYSFRSATHGIATTNAHTRLGRDNPSDTTQWLFKRLPASSFLHQRPDSLVDVSAIRLRDQYDRTFGGDLEANILEGSSGSEQLSGFDGDDWIGAAAGDDLLDGGAGADILDGGLGHDILLGGPGADILDGGGGEDILIGGEGPDIYIFSPGGGHDLVLDDREGQNRVMCQGFDEPPEVFVQGSDWVVSSRDRAQSLRIINSSIVSFYGCGAPRLVLPF